MGRASSPVVSGVSWCSAPAGPRLLVAPSPWPFGSAVGSGRWSHNGCRLATTGIDAKLYSGGGEVVAHSKVSAAHGLGPAGLPHQRAWNQFTNVIPVPTAKMKPPIVEMRFRPSHPRPLGYVEIRRGMPRKHRM